MKTVYRLCTGVKKNDFMSSTVAPALLHAEPALARANLRRIRTIWPPVVGDGVLDVPRRTDLKSRRIPAQTLPSQISRRGGACPSRADRIHDPHHPRRIRAAPIMSSRAQRSGVEGSWQRSKREPSASLPLKNPSLKRRKGLPPLGFPARMATVKRFFAAQYRTIPASRDAHIVPCRTSRFDHRPRRIR